MNKSDLKRLSRAELLELLLDQTKLIDQLRTELAQAQAKLEEREIQIHEAGSIADAAAKINELFAVAQATADQYLESVKTQTFVSPTGAFPKDEPGVRPRQYPETKGNGAFSSHRTPVSRTEPNHDPSLTPRLVPKTDPGSAMMTDFKPDARTAPEDSYRIVKLRGDDTTGSQKPSLVSYYEARRAQAESGERPAFKLTDYYERARQQREANEMRDRNGETKQG